MFQKLHLYDVLEGSIFFKYQMDVSAASQRRWPNLRYQLRRLHNVSSWPVSLRYHLLRRYDAVNLSVLFRYYSEKLQNVSAMSVS